MNRDEGQATALALVSCPVCLAIVEVPIPVRVWLDPERDRIAAEVDNESGWEQPLWDHALNWHGPKLEESA